MISIQEQLEMSRKTGLGINDKVKFQEDANFKLSEKDGKCPFCNKFHDYTIIDDDNEYETTKTIQRTYKEKEEAHWAHFWNIDCVCNNCGEKFTNVEGF